MTQSEYQVGSPHTIVRASAGSGKTYTLTNEFIARLVEGEDPSGMLATTFTRAAAGEILHRVLDRLSCGVLDENALRDLRTAIKKPDLGASRCADVLSCLVSQLHRLSILTIDSFFSRLASSFSLELGLPMSYRMLEEDEDREIRELCVDRAIQECSASEMVELLRSLQGQKVQMQTHSAIMKAAESAYSMYLATDGNKKPWDTISPVGKLMTGTQLDSAMERLAEMQVPNNKSGSPNTNWSNAQTRCIDSVLNRDWDLFFHSGYGKFLLESLGNEDPPMFSKHFFSDEYLEILMPIVHHARYALSAEHINQTVATHALMQRFDTVYRQAKMSSGQLSFDDPPRLLNESKITGDLEHLYFRLDASIRHVMLDEFQDTSMPQFNLLAPILDELLSQNEEGRSVFVVGDVKQSLYSWRQAEPKLLGSMMGRWPMLGERSLSKSWRSSPAVLDAVNDIFGNLASNQAMDSKEIGKQAAGFWDAQYETHQAAKESLPGYVSLTVADGDDESDTQSLDEVLWSCANRVAEARSVSPDASIAVLVRQGKHIYPLLAKLKKLGVDACEDRGNPLVDSPGVAVAVSMLELIDHPSNSAALYHVRSSPLGSALGLVGSNRINSLASDLRMRIAEHGCVPMLIEWLKLCASSMDQRGHTRFGQLIELAGRLEDQGRTGAAPLASVAQSRMIDEPGHAPVRVITIHRSKGLEFDVVVLPLLGQTWRIRPDSILSKRDDPLGPITQVSRYPKKSIRAIHPDLQSLYDQSMLKQINEELCCLYVAMTRAKLSLQMIVPGDKLGRTGEPVSQYKLEPAHLIRAALAPDEPCTPGAILFESSGMNDWINGVESQPEQSVTSTGIEPVTLAIRAPNQQRAGQLMSASPSAQHADSTLNAEQLLSNSQSDHSAQNHGLCVHAGFELFDWVDQCMPSREEIRVALADSGYDQQIISGATKEIDSAIACSPVRDVLSLQQWLTDHPDATGAEVYHERPFAVRIGKPGAERLVQGRIDRLVIGSDGDRVTNAQIVDYKTDRDANGLDAGQLAILAQRHQPQMESYRMAIGAMYGLDESSIEIVILFTHAPGVVYQ